MGCTSSVHVVQTPSIAIATNDPPVGVSRSVLVNFLREEEKLICSLRERHLETLEQRSTLINTLRRRKDKRIDETVKQLDAYIASLEAGIVSLSNGREQRLAQLSRARARARARRGNRAG